MPVAAGVPGPREDADDVPFPPFGVDEPEHAAGVRARPRVAHAFPELAEDYRHSPRDRLELVAEGHADVLALDKVVDVERGDELARLVDGQTCEELAEVGVVVDPPEDDRLLRARGADRVDDRLEPGGGVARRPVIDGVDLAAVQPAIPLPGRIGVWVVPVGHRDLGHGSKRTPWSALNVVATLRQKSSMWLRSGM